MIEGALMRRVRLIREETNPNAAAWRAAALRHQPRCHGTASCYAGGCRRDDCRKAASAARARYRAAKKTRLSEGDQ